MFKVYCRGTRRSKITGKNLSAWVEYSGTFNTLWEAEKCKFESESIMALDMNNNLLMYTVKEVTK